MASSRGHLDNYILDKRLTSLSPDTYMTGGLIAAGVEGARFAGAMAFDRLSQSGWAVPFSFDLLR